MQGLDSQDLTGFLGFFFSYINKLFINVTGTEPVLP